MVASKDYLHYFSKFSIKKLIQLAKEKNVKRSLNRLLLEISNKFKLSYVYGQPIFAQIEPTTYCNCRCIMCGRTYMLKKGDLKPEHMKFKDFKKIMLKMPYCETVHLQGHGEPLFNPDLFKMVRFCKKREIFTRFITNATILSEKVSRKVILSGLELIDFSIDSADAKTFEKIRKEAKFSTVIKNVKRFVELKNTLKSETPVTRAIVIISKENIYKIPPLLELLNSIGIKKVILRGLIRKLSAPTKNGQLQSITPEELNLLPKYKDYGESLGLNVRLSSANLSLLPFSNRKKIKCWKLWKSVYITVDGWVTCCCHIYDKDMLNYGNILKQDFKKIWNSELYKRSRKRLKNNPAEYPCKDVCLTTLM